MTGISNLLPLLLGAPKSAAAGGAPAGGGGTQLITMLVTFGLIIVVFYFLVIRPQNKKQKDAKKMLEGIQQGRQGRHHRRHARHVDSVKDDAVVLKVDDNVKIKFSKSAVSTVLERKEDRESQGVGHLMKKRYRFLLILVLMAVGFYFLWPSIQWYFLTPQADKEMAESSRNQIKVYAQERGGRGREAAHRHDPRRPRARGVRVPRREGRGALQGGQQERARPRGRCATCWRPTTGRTEFAGGRRGPVPRPDVRPEGPEEPDPPARSRPARGHVRGRSARISPPLEKTRSEARPSREALTEARTRW